MPPHDATAMAAAMVRLLKDPSLRARFGDAGRARVERHFTVERMVSATLAAYEVVAGTRTSTGSSRSPRRG